MLPKRFHAVLLIGAFLLLSGIGGGRATVQADQLLQDVPRLDGKNVYFTEGAGEASRFARDDNGLSRFAGLISQLGANLYTLEWRTGFPTDADLIVIAGPRTDFAPDQVARLWAYMNNNGHVLLMVNPVVETAKRSAFLGDSSLFNLMWADMGMRALDDVVVTKDASGAGGLIADFSTGQFNASHPITGDLSGDVAFFTARSLGLDSSIQGYTVTPLVLTTSDYYGETDYAGYLKDGSFNFNIGADTAQGALPLAAAYDNPRTDSRVILLGDKEFATNGAGLLTSPSNSAGFLHPDNARFLINAVSWLLDSAPPSVDFPTPGPTATATITPTPGPTHEATATPTPAS